MPGRRYARRRTSILGALLSLALGLCLTALSMGYAAGVHVTDIDRFREAADAALVQTEIMSAEDAERYAQETIGYLTGRRAAWLSAITVEGQVYPVPEAFTTHMAQVQHWVKAFRFMLPLMIACVVALVFLTLLGAAAMQARSFSPRFYYLGALVPVLVAGILFLWALIDFTSFWDMLHNVFIPGGIFAAGEPVMRLFPVSMFQGYLLPIGLTFLYLLAGIVLLPALLVMLDRRGRRRRMEKQTMPYDPMEYR
ncbi:MAG: DUF1461 domain-containing protein [Firmicutes bacterium]|nr:DUF1461 domain-containing protein [Bacillota bacterium]